ncbi:hypothetical protein QTN47_19390 [Danxiaibacter flavus]|uniref:Uncharacterized protein n=1 Tax=Danxiaibacter flavus TaxID=3049108 RepID=A0ABV3ZIM8_9BACT|nr:hypothetical protein QNM32_19400 [Chitinophagaceae bacterium DXS]
MEVTKRQLGAFKTIVDTYKSGTTFPKRHEWKLLDNNSLWLRLVGQVNVVGGVDGNDRFFERPELIKKINFSSLSKIKLEKELALKINSVLREAGVRYASADLTKCSKTKSLVHNYKFISQYKNGFKGLLQELADIKGETAEVQRVHFLTSNFKYIKNKSARDFLMGLGINRNTVAIDIRIQNIFKRFGLPLPSQAELSRRIIYEAAEKNIVDKICKPLNIEPVQFDRILFQNYDSILKN